MFQSNNKIFSVLAILMALTLAGCAKEPLVRSPDQNANVSTTLAAMLDRICFLSLPDFAGAYSLIDAEAQQQGITTRIISESAYYYYGGQDRFVFGITRTNGGPPFPGCTVGAEAIDLKTLEGAVFAMIESKGLQIGAPTAMSTDRFTTKPTAGSRWPVLGLPQSVYLEVYLSPGEGRNTEATLMFN